MRIGVIGLRNSCAAIETNSSRGPDRLAEFLDQAILLIFATAVLGRVHIVHTLLAAVRAGSAGNEISARSRPRKTR